MKNTEKITEQKQKNAIPVQKKTETDNRNRNPENNREKFQRPEAKNGESERIGYNITRQSEKDTNPKAGKGNEFSKSPGTTKPERGGPNDPRKADSSKIEQSPKIEANKTEEPRRFTQSEIDNYDN